MILSEKTKTLDKYLRQLFAEADDAVQWRMMLNAIHFFDFVGSAHITQDEELPASSYKMSDYEALMKDKVRKTYDSYEKHKLQKMIEYNTRNMTRAERDGFEKTRSEIVKNACKDLPCPFQNIDQHYALKKTAEAVESTIKSMKILKNMKALRPSLGSRVTLGSFPTGNVNGKVLRVPSTNEYLVILEDGIFNFIPDFVWAVMKALTPEIFYRISATASTADVVGYVIEYLNKNPDQANYFFEALKSYAVEGGYETRQMGPLAWEQAVNCLRMSLNSFLVGHEYGHIIDGHYSKRWPHSSPFRYSVESAKSIDRDWHQEFIADQLGAMIAIEHMKNDHYIEPVFSFLGIDLYFSCFSSLLEAISILYTGDVGKLREDKSHPPWEMRRETMRAIMGHKYGYQIIASAESLRDSVLTLWWQVIDKFAELHKQGVRPHSKWRMLQN